MKVLQVISDAAVAALAAGLIAGTGLTGSGVAAASPNTPSCGDIGGVFEAHGIDGRGSCVSADPRRRCHIPPDEQDSYDPTGNYVAELTITPPFPGGTLDPYDVTLIEGASNRDCWKLPS